MKQLSALGNRARSRQLSRIGTARNCDFELKLSASRRALQLTWLRSLDSGALRGWAWCSASSPEGWSWTPPAGSGSVCCSPCWSAAYLRSREVSKSHQLQPQKTGRLFHTLQKVHPWLHCCAMRLFLASNQFFFFPIALQQPYCATFTFTGLVHIFTS